MRSKVLAVATGVLLVAIAATTAIAGHQTSGVKSYTGCLVSGDGVIVKIKEGNAPRSACTGGQVEAHFSGGDITKISVGSGLSIPNGGDNGEVRIELAAGQALPQGCADARVAEWDSGTDTWVCGVDNDTTYTAGTGLDLSLGNAFSIEPGYRLPGKACSTSGQFARGFDASGNIQCASPPSAEPTAGFFSRTSTGVAVAGTTTILTEDLPAGNYLLFAHVTGQNPNFENQASGRCDIPNDSAEILLGGDLDASTDLINENMTLVGAVIHGGGVVALTCTERSGNFDVARASFAAIKVDSLG